MRSKNIRKYGENPVESFLIRRLRKNRATSIIRTRSLNRLLIFKQFKKIARHLLDQLYFLGCNIIARKKQVALCILVAIISLAPSSLIPPIVPPSLPFPGCWDGLDSYLGLAECRVDPDSETAKIARSHVDQFFVWGSLPHLPLPTYDHLSVEKNGVFWV